MIEYLTVAEAAEQLGVTQRTLLNAIRADRLKAVKLGRWRLKREDLADWIDTRANAKPGDLAV